MSIVRIIGGEMKNTTRGKMDLHATEGDFNINAATEINWDGGEGGVVHREYEPLHPDDSLSNEKIVRLNLFFDGTQNNKTNTEAGKLHPNSNHVDDSYTNDYSNVARGFDATDPTKENQVRVYIEGIGTENLKSETTFFGNLPNNSGIPLGEGIRGVKAKVTKGCFEAGKGLNEYAGKAITLQVNVFGFSRGATAARYFLHIATNPVETNNPTFSNYEVALPPFGIKCPRYLKTKETDMQVQKYGFFGACLAKWDVIPANIIFNFVGLYDTVAAYGADHRGKAIPGTTISIIDNDTKQLGLDAVNKASFVLQFAADDEHRDNFDLTNINSAGIHGLEFTLPGVHSDIGGCYVENDSENVDLFYEPYFNRDCNKFKEILEEEGWYKPHELKIVHSYTTDFTKKVPVEYDANPVGNFGLVGTRKNIHNSYDKVALNQMFHYSKQFDVAYKNLSLNDHKIKSSFLITVNNQLVRYINACSHLRNQYVIRFNSGENITNEYLAAIKKIKYQDYINEDDLKTLRNEYLHWSSSATKFGYGPKVGGIKNAIERNRNIQYG
ncbi:DUF2235 domain-containing protein [Flavobacterium branchiarum]|uniref:T6SS phospholipase effector Tle1-like catalytic domain-containing protein n=1 Tax=Flavobacterium branchiarum TaxID=1114870 RepID=A0ABV5FHA7_9FLAO|nr:DUF2235 domain-containing protein [Flavobacterium branchiarum]MDN3671792.1 DUF2235 domain-containing protein [Flavobacterium branchiarum]